MLDTGYHRDLLYLYIDRQSDWIIKKLSLASRITVKYINKEKMEATAQWMGKKDKRSVLAHPLRAVAESQFLSINRMPDRTENREREI